jgi:hypothetical protein
MGKWYLRSSKYWIEYLEGRGFKLEFRELSNYYYLREYRIYLWMMAFSVQFLWVIKGYIKISGAVWDERSAADLKLMIDAVADPGKAPLLVGINGASKLMELLLGSE